jgi:galactosylgalactosylxylosylprotein 3-beta-glucuronosyltransferase 1
VLYLIEINHDNKQATTFIEQLVEDETHMEGIPTGC